MRLVGQDTGTPSHDASNDANHSAGQGRVVAAGRVSKTVTTARRMWPYLLMAWERWQSLSSEEKERYKRQARAYAERGKSMLDAELKRRG
jgi:hypothetical protein